MSSTVTFPPFDFPLTRPAALIVIDMQPVCVSRDVGLAKSMDSLEPGYSHHLVERVDTILVPAIRRLIRNRSHRCCTKLPTASCWTSGMTAK